MNDTELKSLIADYLAGSISSERHKSLQDALRANPQARAAFREMVDLESGLRTWACQDSPAISRTPAGKPSFVSDRRDSRLRRPVYASLAVAASITMIAIAGWFWLHRLDQPDNTAPVPRNGLAQITAQLGTVRQLKDAAWSSPGGLTQGSRFPAGTLALTSGIAEVELDSGTNIIMQGPCELQVLSVDSAQLLLGSVVVQVAGLSDSFALNTPDATIIDEGTEYAVSLDGEATEVHVFDGTVLWKPRNATAEQPGDRIEAGEARRYLRKKPMQGNRIPLGRRQFVRKIEQSVQQGAGGEGQGKGTPGAGGAGRGKGEAGPGGKGQGKGTPGAGGAGRGKGEAGPGGEGQGKGAPGDGGAGRGKGEAGPGGEGLEHLKELKELREFNVSSNKITDAFGWE